MMGYDTNLSLADFPKELNMILLLLNMEEDEKILLKNKEMFDNIDWNLFLKLTRHHRIFPIIYLLLKKLNEKAIPQYVLETLHRDYCKNTFQMLYLSREMEQISRLFTENNIRVLFLRGPILGVDLYGDISLRTSVDLDIFVPIDDLDKVDEILLRHGYKKDEFFSTILEEWKWRHHHLNYIHTKMKTKLEIHWRLNEGPGKEPTFSELWQRRRKSSLTSYPVYYLEKEELFLLLVTHGARHGWSRLGWLVDIDRIVKQNLDWNLLNRLLKKYQCFHIGGQALILTSQLLKTSVVEEMKIFMAGKRPRKLAFEALFYIKQMVNLHAYPIPEDVDRYHKRHLFALMSNRQKFLFILSFFYPYPMDAEALPLPKALQFLYVPLRPILWAWRKTGKHQ